jgi:hypothetical protein
MKLMIRSVNPLLCPVCQVRRSTCVCVCVCVSPLHFFAPNNDDSAICVFAVAFDLLSCLAWLGQLDPSEHRKCWSKRAQVRRRRSAHVRSDVSAAARNRCLDSFRATVSERPGPHFRIATNKLGTEESETNRKSNCKPKRTRTLPVERQQISGKQKGGQSQALHLKDVVTREGVWAWNFESSEKRRVSV